MDETDVEVGVHLYRDIREFNASGVIPTVVVSHLPMGGRRLRRESTPNNRRGKGCEGRREEHEARPRRDALQPERRAERVGAFQDRHDGEVRNTTLFERSFGKLSRRAGFR